MVTASAGAGYAPACALDGRVYNRRTLGTLRGAALHIHRHRARTFGPPVRGSSGQFQSGCAWDVGKQSGDYRAPALSAVFVERWSPMRRRTRRDMPPPPPHSTHCRALSVRPRLRTCSVLLDGTPKYVTCTPPYGSSAFSSWMIGGPSPRISQSPVHGRMTPVTSMQLWPALPFQFSHWIAVARLYNTLYGGMQLMFAVPHSWNVMEMPEAGHVGSVQL